MSFSNQADRYWNYILKADKNTLRSLWYCFQKSQTVFDKKPPENNKNGYKDVAESVRSSHLDFSCNVSKSTTMTKQISTLVFALWFWHLHGAPYPFPSQPTSNKNLAFISRSSRIRRKMNNVFSHLHWEGKRTCATIRFVRIARFKRVGFVTLFDTINLFDLIRLRFTIHVNDPVVVSLHCFLKSQTKQFGSFERDRKMKDIN